MDEEADDPNKVEDAEGDGDGNKGENEDDEVAEKKDWEEKKEVDEVE